MAPKPWDPIFWETKCNWNVHPRNGRIFIAPSPDAAIFGGNVVLNALPQFASTMEIDGTSFKSYNLQYWTWIIWNRVSNNKVLLDEIDGVPKNDKASYRLWAMQSWNKSWDLMPRHKLKQPWEDLNPKLWHSPKTRPILDTLPKCNVFAG